MTIPLEGRRIAIIGGAGFIGHHLALSFAQQKAQVDVIDSLQVNNLLYFKSAASGDAAQRELYTRLINQRLELLKEAGIALHPQDARDYHALSRVLDSIKPQVIIHLAAVAHAGKANKDPFSTFDHSLRTLENALDYTRGARVEHFVYFSSSMVYGNFKTDQVREEDALDPIGIYGALKLAGEKIVIAYNQVFDLPYTIVRPSALYGPRCVSRRVGQIYIENALAGKPLRVDGDGQERLDFTYIDDLVQGIELALQKPAARNQIFNITYGQSRSILDLIEVLRPLLPKLHVEFVERDKLMPFRGTLSTVKAKTLLGYAPENPIDVGFPKYVASYQSLNGTYASV